MTCADVIRGCACSGGDGGRSNSFSSYISSSYGVKYHTKLSVD